MASGFRKPKHEQDEIRMDLPAEARPYQPSATEETLNANVEKALAVFDAHQQHHKLMLEKAESLPKVILLVAAYRKREAELTHQLEEQLKGRVAELRQEHMNKLAEALQQQDEKFVQRENNIIQAHQAEIQGIQVALSVEAPDVAITFFKDVPNDIALQLVRRSLAATRTGADLKQAHMDIEFMIASASELYGACVADTIRVVYQQFESLQLLMHRQIPELDIGKTGSLEETMASATALQDWTKICSEKSGNFIKGIWGKHVQLLEALKDMIKHDRVLSKGYIELREDMKEAMEVIEAQGV